MRLRAHLQRQLLPRFLFRRRKRADSLEDVCRALCPNADGPSTRFRSAERSKRPRRRRGSPTRICPTPANSRELRSGLLVPAQGGELGGSAARAEARYGHEKLDILVTPEKSAEMARPIIDPKAKPTPDAKGKPGPRNASMVAGPGAAPGATPSSDAATAVLDANGADTKLSAEAATVSRETWAFQATTCRGRELHRELGPKSGIDRTRRRQTLGADSRASALARPMSGRRAASSGPASRPVRPGATGETGTVPCGR